MYKYRLGFVLGFCLLTITSFAQDRSYEGMWLPYKAAQVNYSDMKSLGFALSDSLIYNEKAPSLEDGIVRLNDGMCTAELISGEGLVLTNHHCAYEGVADLSSLDRDILSDGFWAMTREEEIPIPNYTASFLIHSEDVTAKIMAAEDPEEAIAAIEKKATEGGKYKAEVKEMFAGAEYNLFVYKVYRDVRLVGVPPSSIGKFGGDTDNWVWPRHTGDFAMIRIYADADNEPADYAAENQPYHPKFHFPISLKGVEENDYAMIMGYPGSTERYLTSSAVQLLLDQTNDDRISLLGAKTSIMKSYMDSDPEIRIALAGDYASLMNYYKYLIGQTTMMKRYDVPGIMALKEAKFQEWADAEPARKEKYGSVLTAFAELYGSNKEIDKAVSYTYLGAFASNTVLNARNFVGFALAPEARFPALTERVKPEVEASFEGFYPEMEKEILKSILLNYYENVPEEFRAPVVEELLNPAPMVMEETGKKKKKKKNAPEPMMEMMDMTTEEKVDNFVNMAFATSIVVNQDLAEAFLQNPTKEVAVNDPLVKLSTGLILFFQQNMGAVQEEYDAAKAELEKTYIEGMREMHADEAFYPDANSTMRLTYGKVLPYEPRDGVEYSYYTTLEGIMEKEDESNPEFVVPAKLKSLYLDKDYGQYGTNGDLNVCFLTTNDITGGNSGSPVLNSRGELIGCAFDGNWEAMSGDIHVFPSLNRTIAVDARYVLFVVDKFAGASHLIKEMTIVK